MYTRIIGDIHGRVYDYQSYAIRDFKGPTIQVGDFGVGFAGPSWHDDLAKWQSNNPQHRFIRGNHDNLTKCKLMPGYIPDGLVENHTMFIGGAWSIDHAWRTEGVNWWADEECSYQQLEQLIEVYSIVKPKVMITHDCPTVAAVELFQKHGLLIGGSSAKLESTRTASAFQAMYEIHQPDYWFFGHWHYTTFAKIGNTYFQCIGELDYLDVDLNSLEVKID